MHCATTETCTDPKAARTMPQLLRAAALAYGDDPAVVLRNEGEDSDTLSFVQLERKSAHLASVLIAKGVGKGARVGFIYGNGPDFAVVLSAISRIGAIAVPVSTLIKANELVRVLRQSDVQVLIVQRHFLGKDYVERLCQALPALHGEARRPLLMAETPFLRSVISTGGDLPPAIEDLDALLAATGTISEELLTCLEREVHPTDQMIEIYTSGSMALPKGVKHAHGPVLFRTHTLRPLLGPQRGTERPVSLPMFWVGGLMMFLLPCLEVGAVAVCSDRTLSNARFAIGSVLADEDLAKMKGKPPYWGLGMTETLGPYAWSEEFRAPGYPVCAPMDHFLEGFDIRVSDAEDRPVADGEIGEVQIRGHAFTSGLHKVERSHHFTVDGYYRTGDTCLVQGERLLFAGRTGDMIKSASSNVSPAEVEMELQDLEGIQNAYVVGIPDEERGQLVTAALVPRPGASIDPVAIERQLRERLSGFKVPRAYIVLDPDDVPLLPSNKVARRVIADMIAQQLDRVHAEKATT